MLDNLSYYCNIIYIMEIPLAKMPETPEQSRQRILDEKNRLFKATQYISARALQSFEGGPIYEAIKKGDQYVDDTLSSITNRLSELLGNSKVRLDNLLEILGFTKEMLKDPVAGFYGGNFYGTNTECTVPYHHETEHESTKSSIQFIPLDNVSFPVSFAEYQKQRISYFADYLVSQIQPKTNLLADSLPEFYTGANPEGPDTVENNEASLQDRLAKLKKRKSKLVLDKNIATQDWLLAQEHLRQHQDNYDSWRNYDYEIKDEKMQYIEDFLEEKRRTLNRIQADILDEIDIIDAQICTIEYGIACAQGGTFLNLQDLVQFQIFRLFGEGINRYQIVLDLVWSLALDALRVHLEQEGPYSDVDLGCIGDSEIFIGGDEIQFLQEYISGEGPVEVANKIAEIIFDKISVGLFETPVYQPPDKLQSGVASSVTRSTVT